MTGLPRIALDVPEQPPVGSIVLGEQGVAWQRRGDGWFAAGPVQLVGTSWANLLIAMGSVEVLHVPTDLEVAG